MNAGYLQGQQKSAFLMKVSKNDLKFFWKSEMWYFMGQKYANYL